MTKEQKDSLKVIDKRLRLLFPDFYGNIQFNINPKAPDVNVNIQQNFRERKD